MKTENDHNKIEGEILKDHFLKRLFHILFSAQPEFNSMAEYELQVELDKVRARLKEEESQKDDDFRRALEELKKARPELKRALDRETKAQKAYALSQ